MNEAKARGTARDAWIGRARTAEAVAALALARILVAFVPFHVWRSRYGSIVPVGPLVVASAADPQPQNLAARRLARAVDRAAARLPGASVCLPRAMALQALLISRRIGTTLVLGVLPGAQRGSIDDLHAWVAAGGEILIGGDLSGHVPLLALQREF
ncbi:lasso peptide biosynthesis B2 protein [Novosphingobium tardum]|uniref:Lasso peptide biosynthesis B2 protein n=1 Tax=Novosphingobium tardum TaxID=1538021 RepID=A0ABV8RNJ8_9SPHN